MSGRAVAVAVEGVDEVEPVGGRAFQGAALDAELLLDLGAHENSVADHVPVEYDVPGA